MYGKSTCGAICVVVLGFPKSFYEEIIDAQPFFVL